MAAYRFRVTFEDDSDLYRDIDILTEQSFLQLHNAIIKAFEFTSNELASFYLSDDNWRKGDEIALEDMNDEDAELPPVKLMRKSIVADFIEDPHQKFVYVFDFLKMWTFYVELVKIIPKEDIELKYPAVTKSGGEIPKQFKNITPSVVDDEDLDDEDDKKLKRSTKSEFNALEQYDADYEGDDEIGEDENDEFDEFSSGHTDSGNEDY